MANDILDFSRQPGVVTYRARKRMQLFKTWFVRIFNRWYVDLFEASQKDSRKCLTDNFASDYSSNLNKDCVLTSHQRFKSTLSPKVWDEKYLLDTIFFVSNCRSVQHTTKDDSWL